MSKVSILIIVIALVFIIILTIVIIGIFRLNKPADNSNVFAKVDISSCESKQGAEIWDCLLEANKQMPSPLPVKCSMITQPEKDFDKKLCLYNFYTSIKYNANSAECEKLVEELKPFCNLLALTNKAKNESNMQSCVTLSGEFKEYCENDFYLDKALKSQKIVDCDKVINPDSRQFCLNIIGGGK